MSLPWSEDDFALALKMLERRESNAAFIKAFGRTKKAAETRRDRIKNGAVPRIYSKGKPRTRSFTETSERFVVPADVRADADRRASIGHHDLTAAFCRDPLPGMSALDRRRSA